MWTTGRPVLQPDTEVTAAEKLYCSKCLATRWSKDVIVEADREVNENPQGAIDDLKLDQKLETEREYAESATMKKDRPIAALDESP